MHVYRPCMGRNARILALGIGMHVYRPWVGMEDVGGGSHFTCTGIQLANWELHYGVQYSKVT